MQGIGTLLIHTIRLNRRTSRSPRPCSSSGQRMGQSCATVTIHAVAQVSAMRPCAVVLRLDWVTGFRNVPVAVIAAYAGQSGSAVRSELNRGNCDDLLGRVLSLYTCCLHVECSERNSIAGYSTMSRIFVTRRTVRDVSVTVLSKCQNFA